MNGTLFWYVTSQPRPTQPFILSGSINWVVSNFIGECSRGYAGAVDSIAVRRVWQQCSRLNPSVYSAALRGGCCVPLCVADVGIVNWAVCQQFNKKTLFISLFKENREELYVRLCRSGRQIAPVDRVAILRRQAEE